MKSKKIVILLALIIALVGVTSGLIVAWLTDTKTTTPTEFSVGDVKFSWNGAMTEKTPIVPGQDLIETDYTLTNNSTVTTELRVRLVITYTLLNETDPVNGSNLFVNNPIKLATGWTLDLDGNYYWGAKDTPTKILVGTVESPVIIPVISELRLNGNLVGNSFDNAVFSFSFIFEAKQEEFVNWEQLGTAKIDFNTGLTS